MKQKNQKQQTVLVGLSGGVDSAVATLLLQKRGFKVIGAFMKNFSRKLNKLQGQCNWRQDLKDAQEIAKILNIPLLILDFQKEYKKHVIDPMFKAYTKGLTPNPDSLCNKIIKFPLLWKEAQKLKADYIATGHYIKKIKKGKKFSLKIPKDKTKDQSYFLYDLTQKNLSHTLFPIGQANLTKTRVRKIAKKHKFPNHNKRGTRGICFIGKINLKQFLKQKIKPKPGKILDVKGNIIGKHEGIMFYTIGERIGPRSGTKLNKEIHENPHAPKKWYIADKIISKNILIASPEGSKDLKKDSFKIINTNWINKTPKFPIKCKTRIRHLGTLEPAKITKHQNTLICKLKHAIQGLAEGQSAVIYKKSIMLGGGEIRYN